MKQSLVLLCLIAIALPLHAAVVNVGPLETSYQDLEYPYASSIEKSSSITVDLSNLSGLTSGTNIQITFSTANILIWTGLWRADTGSVTLNYGATLTLTVGSQSVSSSPTWSPFGPVDFENPGSSIGGYELGPVPDAFSLTVPWGSDLSNVTLTLTDSFSITGPGAGIENSGLSLDSLTLTTTSVPEPSALILTILSSAVMIRRKRH